MKKRNVLLICILCFLVQVKTKASEDTLRVQLDAQTMLEFVYYDRLEAKEIDDCDRQIKAFLDDYDKLPDTECKKTECISQITYSTNDEQSKFNITKKEVNNRSQFVVKGEEVFREKGYNYVVYLKCNSKQALRIYATDIKEIKRLNKVQVDEVLRSALQDLKERQKRRWGVSSAFYNMEEGQLSFETYERHTADILLMYPTVSLGMYNQSFVPQWGMRLGFINSTSSFSDGFSIFVSYEKFLLYGEKQEKNLYWQDYADFLSLELGSRNDNWGDETWIEVGLGMLIDHSSPQAFPKDAYKLKLKTYYGKLGIGLDIIASDSYDDNIMGVMMTVDFSGLLPKLSF